MATTVWSTKLLRGASAFTGSTTYTVPGSALAVVIRCIDVINKGQRGPLNGLTVQDLGGITIWEIDRPWALGFTPYHWEGHQTFLTSEGFQVVHNDSYWNWSISGFLFGS